MTGRPRSRPADDVDTTLRREGVHVVHGSLVRCCEQDETDCPCTCHDQHTEETP